MLGLITCGAGTDIYPTFGLGGGGEGNVVAGPASGFLLWLQDALHQHPQGTLRSRIYYSQVLEGTQQAQGAQQVWGHGGEHRPSALPLLGVLGWGA